MIFQIRNYIFQNTNFALKVQGKCWKDDVVTFTAHLSVTIKRLTRYKQKNSFGRPFWPVSKIFFRPFRPQFVLKIRGGGAAGPPGLSPGSATALCKICTNLCPPIIHPRGVKHLQVPRYEKKGINQLWSIINNHQPRNYSKIDNNLVRELFVLYYTM